ncbi:MAG: glutamate--cysteine ligase [Gammaproteobacteria bacterium]|nr:glutamate--cysteine ligase [Gammaproteobacteria bacterium]
MGQEIDREHFTRHDYGVFSARLREETALLKALFETQGLSQRHHVAGFELEAWLVDGRFRPAPLNLAFMERFAGELVAPELASFNIEFNTAPRSLTGTALRAMEHDLAALWQRASGVAHDLDARLLMIGILPTVRQEDLSMANMTPLKRYRALNEQVLRLRRGRPLRLDIRGDDHLRLEHHDVMLEAAATSFQLHLQVHPLQAARYYNAAKIISGPLTALCANAPLLFGRRLWAETRIPLFEQAVAVGYGQEHNAPHDRVTFGYGYVQQSLLECFLTNASEYEILLPIGLSAAPRELSHLRLHNGTIWRWNRPLIGFDADGTPHVRIEHRPLPAGPTIVDTIANAALFYGLVEMLATMEEAPELSLPFAAAKANFYTCARDGLAAEVTWLDGRVYDVADLLQDELLPLARRGLTALRLAPEDIERYLGTMVERLAGGQTGSDWQRRFLDLHDNDLFALTAAYHVHQQGGAPVHRWPAS